MRNFSRYVYFVQRLIDLSSSRSNQCRRSAAGIKSWSLGNGEKKAPRAWPDVFFTVRSDNKFPQSIGHFLQQARAFLSSPRRHFALRFFFLAASPPPDAGELLLPLASKKWPSSSTSLAALLMCLNRSPRMVVGPVQCSASSFLMYTITHRPVKCLRTSGSLPPEHF